MKKRVGSLIAMQKCDDKIADKENLKSELPKQLKNLIEEEEQAKRDVEVNTEENNKVIIIQKDKENIIKKKKNQKCLNN